MESKAQVSSLSERLSCSPTTLPFQDELEPFPGSHNILGLYILMAAAVTLYFNICLCLSINSCGLLTSGLERRDGESR